MARAVILKRKIETQEGAFRALKLFHEVSRCVPAYRDFLQKHSVRSERIKTIFDFKHVPIIDKKNYIQQYALEELFPHGKIPPMVYASSGSSGKPTFWFRGDAQEVAGGEIHELIFKRIFNIDKEKSTLVVVCFAMGVWVAGNYTVAACREVARRGYRISVISPGIDRDDICYVLRDLASKFEQVILAGYPPFLMDVVNEAHKQGIRLGRRVFAITAGDAFEEVWRAAFLKYLGAEDKLHSLVSIYGSADAGVLGHETPASIFVRQTSLTASGLYRDLFGEPSHALPALFQYSPRHIFFEAVNGELVFTANTAAPLIRYNIHDLGAVISWESMVRLLREHGVIQERAVSSFETWKLPFLMQRGRTDVAVTFYALNIYPEHLKAGIEDRRVSRFLSGNFAAYNKTTVNQRDQKLYIHLQLAPGVRPTLSLERVVIRSVIENLVKHNIEFRKLYTALGERAVPRIRLLLYHDKSFCFANTPGLLALRGKKPKLILS